MNIHPIFVHFPIALLTLYAIIEMIRSKHINLHGPVFYLKAVLVITGWLGVQAALQTGESAVRVSEFVKDYRLLRMHETFANITTWIFGLLALLYVIAWIKQSPLSQKIQNGPFKKIWSIIALEDKWLIDNQWLPVVAFLGFIAVLVVGSLGGAIVYGTNADPVVLFITTILGF